MDEVAREIVELQHSQRMEFNLGEFAPGLAIPDPVDWVEATITHEGGPMLIRDTGRDYLHELYDYMCRGIFIEQIPLLIVKGRQTECTTTVRNSVAYNMKHIGFMGMLWTYPKQKQASRFSKTYWDSMISRAQAGSLEGWYAHSEADNTELKTFINGSQIHMLGAGAGGEGKEADTVRQVSAKGAVKDEYQDFDSFSEKVVNEAMSHTDRYFDVSLGTPKEESTRFHQLWKASDMREYFLGCEKCGAGFLLTMENFVEGFICRCATCGHLQDKRDAIARGQWRPTGKQRGIVRGYHLSQLLVPHITKEIVNAKVKRAELESGVDPVRYLKNEILGEFYSGIGHKIELADIQGAFRPELPLLEYLPPGMKSYAGTDWGGWNAQSRSGSFLCHCIGVIDRDDERDMNRIRVVYAEVLDNEDMLVNLRRIAELNIAFNVDINVADKGWGKMQIFELRKTFGNRLIACNYIDSVDNWYSFTTGRNGDDPTIKVDRDISLEETHLFMKHGRLVVPFNDRTEWIRDHCLGHRVETVERAGRMRRKFVRIPNRLTDGVHMLNYLKLACSHGNRKALQTYLSRPAKGLPLPVMTGAQTVVNGEGESQQARQQRPRRRAVPLGSGWRGLNRHRR